MEMVRVSASYSPDKMGKEPLMILVGSEVVLGNGEIITFFLACALSIPHPNRIAKIKIIFFIKKSLEVKHVPRMALIK